MEDKPVSCDKCPHMRSYQDGYNSGNFIARCKALESKKFYDEYYEVSNYKNSVPWWCPKDYFVYSFHNYDDDMG